VRKVIGKAPAQKILNEMLEDVKALEGAAAK
jgi:hypothetical protein